MAASRLVLGLALGAAAAPVLVAAVEWLVFQDLFAVGLGALFLGVPIALGLLLAAVLVHRLRPRVD